MGRTFRVGADLCRFLGGSRLIHPRPLCSNNSIVSKGNSNGNGKKDAAIGDNDVYRQLEKLDFMTAAKILFTAPPKEKQFGLDFHLVQLFFVCMPSLAVYLVAQYARYEIRRMEAEIVVETKKPPSGNDKHEGTIRVHHAGVSSSPQNESGGNTFATESNTGKSKPDSSQERVNMSDPALDTTQKDPKENKIAGNGGFPRNEEMQEVELKKKQEEEKVKEMKATEEKEEVISDPELLEVKVRLNALEETVKEIVGETKKLSGGNDKREGSMREHPAAVGSSPQIKSEGSTFATESNSSKSKPDSIQDRVNVSDPALDASPKDQKGNQKES